MIQGKTNPFGWPRWLWRCLMVLAAMMAAYCVAGSVSNFARSAGVLRDGGPPTVTLARPPGTPIGWSRVMAVAPGASAAEAGLRPGDLVRFERFLGYNLLSRTAWSQPLTVERDGAHFRTEIGTAPIAPSVQIRSVLAFWGIGGLATVALAVLLLFRARRNRAAVMLTMLLLAYGMISLRNYPMAPAMSLAVFWILVSFLITPAIGYFKLLFALEVSGGGWSPRFARLVHAAALAFAALFAAVALADLLPAPVPVFGSVEKAQATLIFANNLLLFAIIAWNYRRNDAAARNRIKIVVMAFALYMVAVQLRIFVGDSVALQSWRTFSLSALGFTVLEYIGLALLAYSVLRQRLFDFGFALNRTLVYGAVSFILLAGFGLAEWSVEHLIPEAWHEGGPFISAGIAVALFLSFHRLRDWVERHVERLFFSGWHRNEAVLRRFVASTGHFDQAPVLCSAFVEHLRRFSGEAEAALYLRGASGEYRLACGALAGAPPAYGEDHADFALMKAERRPLELPGTNGALPGTMALPMLDHGILAGFVLLGRKFEGSRYRPDEVEVLGWAAHQVGLDLQALRARTLEGEVVGLRQQVALLSKLARESNR